MDWVDQKYIGLISSRLPNFKRKGPSLYNFSCIFCGDSERDKRKARGYLYDQKGSTYFFCHNVCGGMTFGSFIKKIDALRYQEWRLEKLQFEGKAKPPEKEIDFETGNSKKIIVSETLSLFKQLPTVFSLSETHEARKLLNARKIPEYWQKTFRYCTGFKSFTNSMLPKKFKDEKTNNDGRIIIPFFDQTGELFAYQGRAVGATEKQMRYITIVLNKDKPCLWGLDKVDLDRATYVTEGTLDAIFIDNSLAIAGGNFASLQALGSKNIVMVYDNEPRSKDTKAKMLEAVDQGFKIVVWPNSIGSKDINDMIVKEGLTSDYIQYILENYTFAGLGAKAAIIEWSKAK